VGAMKTAYTDAAGRPTGGLEKTNVLDGLIAVVTTLEAGVYTWSTGVDVTADITFTGSSTDVFILQTSGNVLFADGIKVILAGGVKAENIFWQVAGLVDVGPTAHMEGVILAKTSVTFKTGSSLNGRILAQTAVILQKATITEH
jgi:hypothetical protein